MTPPPLFIFSTDFGLSFFAVLEDSFHERLFERARSKKGISCSLSCEQKSIWSCVKRHA